MSAAVEHLVMLGLSLADGRVKEKRSTGGGLAIYSLVLRVEKLGGRAKDRGSGAAE